MICSKCGATNKDTSKFCSHCGAVLEAADTYTNEAEVASVETPVAAPAPVIPTPIPTETIVAEPEDPAKGMAIAAMICGICGFFCLGIPGIVGIILGAIAKKNGSKSGMSTAGIVCGAIALGLWTIYWIIVGIASCVAVEAANSSYYYYY